MKARALLVRLPLLLIAAMLCTSASAQFIWKQAWIGEETNPAFKAKFVGADIYGNSYELVTVNQPSTKWYVRIRDVFGNWTNDASGEALPAIAMDVDPNSGNFFVAASDGTNGGIYFYHSDGQMYLNQPLGSETPLGIAVDVYDGQVTVPSKYSGGLDVLKFSVDGFQSFNGGGVGTIVPVWVKMDNRGNLVVSGTVSGTPSKHTIRSYDWLVNQQWDRTYTDTTVGSTTTSYTNADFFVDQHGNQYQLENIKTVTSGVTTKQYKVHVINGSLDLFSFTGNGDGRRVVAGDTSNIYVAAMGTGPSLDMWAGSTEQWSSPTAVDAIGVPPDSSGSVLIAFYRSDIMQVEIQKFSSTHALEYSLSYPATATTDVGQIQWVLENNSWSSAYLVGSPSTGGGSVEETKILEGPAVNKVFLLPSAVGGNSTPGAVALTGPWTSNYYVYFKYDPQGVFFVDGGFATVPGTKSTADYTCSTQGVDSATTVTVTGYDSRGATATGQITVQAATLTAVTLSSSSVTPNHSVTGTLRLNGAAGPSGRKIFLASDNSHATVPDPVLIGAQSKTNTFNVTTSPVSASTVVHITATDGVSPMTVTLTLTPPVLASLTPTAPTVVGGNTVTLTANLTGNLAAASSASLKSSNTAVLTVPSSVAIAQSASSAAFVAHTSTVTSTQTVNVTATYLGVTKTSVVTVNP